MLRTSVRDVQPDLQQLSNSPPSRLLVWRPRLCPKYGVKCPTRSISGRDLCRGPAANKVAIEGRLSPFKALRLSRPVLPPMPRRRQLAAMFLARCLPFRVSLRDVVGASFFHCWLSRALSLQTSTHPRRPHMRSQGFARRQRNMLHDTKQRPVGAPFAFSCRITVNQSQSYPFSKCAARRIGPTIWEKIQQSFQFSLERAAAERCANLRRCPIPAQEGRKDRFGHTCKGSFLLTP